MIKRFDHNDFILEGKYCFSPDGKYLVVDSYVKGKSELICLQDMSVVQLSNVFRANFESIRFSSDGNYLFVVYGDKAELIHLPDQAVVKTFNNTCFRTDVFSPDSKYLHIKYRNDTAELINLHTMELIKKFNNPYSPKFSPKGGYIVRIGFDCRSVSVKAEMVRTSDMLVIKRFDNFHYHKFSSNENYLFIKYIDKTGELIKLNNDYLPAQSGLLLKVIYSIKQNEKVNLTQEEYETYQSLNEHAKEKIKDHIIFPWQVRAINRIKEDPKAVIGTVVAGIAGAGVWYWLKKD